MQRVTGEHRDSLIEGFAREALHLEMRDVYAAADHSRFRRWQAGETFDPGQEAKPAVICGGVHVAHLKVERLAGEAFYQAVAVLTRHPLHGRPPAGAS